MADDPTPDIDEASEPRPAHGANDDDRPFVPDAFVVPAPPHTAGFWLEPLGVQHNAADYEAWTSSMEHIRATPGFAGWGWPHPMTLEDNASDLERHADDFDRRVGFTYTVRSAADDDVIGCVYIYPGDDASVDASVRSWVRSSEATMDAALWRTVSQWIQADWPFTRIEYAAR